MKKLLLAIAVMLAAVPAASAQELPPVQLPDIIVPEAPAAIRTADTTSAKAAAAPAPRKNERPAAANPSPAPSLAEIAAASATVGAVDRAEAGDTTVLVMHIAGTPGVRISEPYYLADRARVFVDFDRVAISPDSAALAALAGGNLVAIVPQLRAGGTAIAIDLRTLAGYRVVETDSTVTLYFASSIAAPVAEKATPAAPAAADVTISSRIRATIARLNAWLAPRLLSTRAIPAPLLLLMPVALLLLAATTMIVRRRRTGTAVPAPAMQPAEPDAVAPAFAPAFDSRIWTARTLGAAGASTTEILRRTGLPRDAIHFLRSQSPAEIAGSGTNYRAAHAG